MPRQKLTQRNDGYFKCKYHGKQFYGKTQAEAFRLRDEYIAAEKAGIDHTKADVKFLDFALNWISLYRANCGLPQQKQYIGIVNFAADFLQKEKLKDITTYDLQALVNALTVYSVSYINKLLNTLRGIFASAVANGVIARNPMTEVIRPKGKKCEGHRHLEQWERELILNTWQGHDFGLAAMVMLYTGMRRGEVLYLDVDRDVDFENKTVTVRGAVSFAEGNQATVTDGKTEAALRTIPLVAPLEMALKGHHGLICAKEDGGLMSQSAFDRKYASYITYLETCLNGCHKRWYGKTKEHKALLAEGKELAPWRNVTIRCHDFRVDFCTRCREAGVDDKVLQSWMGHADVMMILRVYAKITPAKKEKDSASLDAYMKEDLNLLDSSTAPAEIRQAV